MEDGPGTGTTVSSSAAVSVTRVGSGAISFRRDDTTIAFECEHGCSCLLEIRQHKGDTLVSWLRPAAAVVLAER